MPDALVSPHAALEDPRADAIRSQDAEERHVGAVGKQLAVLDRWPDRRQLERLELRDVGHRDRALRVADLDMLKRPRAVAGRQLAEPVCTAAGEVG